LDAINQPILELFGMNLSTMDDYFPYALSSVDALKYFGIAILFIILIFQLVRSMAGPLSDGENPARLLARSVLFLFLIWNSKELFEYLITLCSTPYDIFLNEVSVEDSFTFSGIWDQINTWTSNLALTMTGLGTIIGIIMVVAIAWNWFKLLLESVERYVMLGVLCYTSPLALATGASQSTVNIFKAWCRMVASQLMLLILNVWFLRGFSSCIASGIADGGAVASTEVDGYTSNFLFWMFAALAWLKIGQRVDTYLATIGMSAAQTGSSMAMEMLMASRVVSSVGSGIAGRASSVFTRNGGSSGVASGATGGSPITGGGGAASPFTNFLGRASVANTQADANSINGQYTTPFSAASWLGRHVAGAQTAMSEQGLSGSAISRVANNANDPRVLGSSALDRGLANGNYISSLNGQNLSGSQVSSGHISTTATGADGSATDLDFWNTSMYDQPEGGFSVVSAADGSSWYQCASGDGCEAFYDTPSFSGGESAADYAAAFPSMSDDGTTLHTVEAGVLAAADSDGGDAGMWYSSAMYDEPSRPYTSIMDANGTSWYQVSSPTAIPSDVSGATHLLPDAGINGAVSCTGNQTQGMFEIKHDNGDGTRFYDSTRYASPTNIPSRTYKDINGHEWYAIAGTRRENGNVTYGASPRYLPEKPEKRSTERGKAPRRKF
jgi:hypothetical protein